MFRCTKTLLYAALLSACNIPVKGGDVDGNTATEKRVMDASTALVMSKSAEIATLLEQFKNANAQQRAAIIATVRARQQEMLDDMQALKAQLPARPKRTLAQMDALIPQDTAPALKAALKARNKFVVDFDDFQSGAQNLTPEQRSQALAQWIKQHGAQFDAIRTGMEITTTANPRVPATVDERLPAQLRAKLQTREQVADAFAQFQQEHQNDTPEARSQALAQWAKDHGAALDAAQSADAETNALPESPGTSR